MTQVTINASARVPCRHWQDELNIGGHTVWASGVLGAPKTGSIPQLGVYMDPDWLAYLDLEMVTPGLNLGKSTDETAYFVPWGDYKALNGDRFKRIVKEVAKKIRQATIVEVGCGSGHGRTGTLLAGLIVEIEGMSAANAIKSIRSRYCNQAVETRDQEDMIYILTGEDLPPRQPIRTVGSAFDWRQYFDLEDDEEEDSDDDNFPIINIAHTRDGLICSICNYRECGYPDLHDRTWDYGVCGLDFDRCIELIGSTGRKAQTHRRKHRRED